MMGNLYDSRDVVLVREIIDFQFFKITVNLAHMCVLRHTKRLIKLEDGVFGDVVEASVVNRHHAGLVIINFYENCTFKMSFVAADQAKFVFSIKKKVSCVKTEKMNRYCSVYLLWNDIYQISFLAREIIDGIVYFFNGCISGLQAAPNTIRL